MKGIFPGTIFLLFPHVMLSIIARDYEAPILYPTQIFLSVTKTHFFQVPFIYVPMIEIAAALTRLLMLEGASEWLGLTG